MHKGTRSNGTECDIYDNIEEVTGIIGYSPPRYCNQCAAELRYYSFFDSLNRFTMKTGCPVCHESWAVSVNKDKYEQKMLQRWTERVKERDDYKCRMASAECSGSLHAHHMIPKAMAPGVRFDVENGITLCEFHHKQIHRFM